MSKNQKQILILLGVLVVLAAVYFGLGAWNDHQEEKEKEQDEAETVYVTDMQEIELINYDIGDGTVTFEKQDGTWKYVKDPDFPLDETYPEQIAETFGNLEATRSLEDGDEAEDYGLDEPVYRVNMKNADGEETTVYFGNNTSDGDYYVTVDDTGKFYTVSSDVVTELQYELGDMAKYDEYPGIGSGNLKKEVITQNGETTTYDSENEDDAEAIAAVAGGLGVVQLDTAADYSVEDTDLPAYGLDDASRITVEVTYTKDEEEQTMTLYIGSEDGNGNRYVMYNNSRIVYLISTSICNNILNVDEE